jgi:arylsulfatase A-like enzyme
LAARRHATVWFVPNPPNLILAVLDTARADEVLRPGVLPGIRALAERGMVFSNAISPAPWTLPSHASLFSGLLPNEHGLTGDLALAGGHLRPVEGRIGELADRWVPAVLQRAGYETFAASANPWITRRMGFGAGFDRFVETGPAIGNVRFDPFRVARIPVAISLSGLCATLVLTSRKARWSALSAAMAPARVRF